MTQRIALGLLGLLLASPLAAIDQQFLEPVMPTSSTLKAQGGASTANATGWDALFVNPASYADETTSITFLSVESTANIPLTTLNEILENRDSLSNTNYLDPTNPMAALVNKLLTQSGVGAEASVGAGWVGGNLGTGIAFQARTQAKGSSLLGSKVAVDTTLEGVIGMGWPFDVGVGTLRLGGALRPMQKAYMVVPMTDVLNNTSNLSDLSIYTVSSGFGLAWDLGARWDYAGFKTGLVVRDMGSTVFSFKDYGLDEIVSQYGFPTSGGSSSGTILYRIPAVIGLGTTWSPELGSLRNLVQPSVSFDLQIPIKDEYTQPSFWTWTHFGAEAEFLRFLSVRTGLNQGYFTFGLGIHFFLLDFNLALYTDELGRYSGLSPRSAMSAEWALRL